MLEQHFAQSSPRPNFFSENGPPLLIDSRRRAGTRLFGHLNALRTKTFWVSSGDSPGRAIGHSQPRSGCAPAWSAEFCRDRMVLSLQKQHLNPVTATSKNLVAKNVIPCVTRQKGIGGYMEIGGLDCTVMYSSSRNDHPPISVIPLSPFPHAAAREDCFFRQGRRSGKQAAASFLTLDSCPLALSASIQA
jgi:hypothetical protein